MKLKTIAKCVALGLALSVMPLQAQTNDTVVEKKSRLTIGGYGEAVYTRNFYSDNMFRYSHAERYKDAKGHGRVDLPQEDLALQRLYPAQTSHGERHPHGLVPHHSALGTWTFSHLHGSQRPFA